MAICEIINEYGALEADLRPTHKATGIASAAAIGLASFAIGSTLNDQMALADTATNNSAATVLESMHASIGYEAFGEFDASAHSAMGGHGSAWPVVIDVIGETLLMLDYADGGQAFEIVADQLNISAEAHPGDVSAEATASESATLQAHAFGVKAGRLDVSMMGGAQAVPGLSLSETVGSAATISGAASITWTDTARDQFSLLAEAIDREPAVEIVASTMTMTATVSVVENDVASVSAALSGAAHPSNSTAADLHASLEVEAAAMPAVRASETIAEDLVIADLIFEPGSFGAVVAPSDTFAASVWSIPEGESIVEIAGELYVGGSTGLYRLDYGADDEGSQKISAYVRGGLTDFGSAALKRAAYLYLGWRGSGPLRATMGSIPYSDEQSFSYEIERPAANNSVPARVRLGRGARSRYWRLTLENRDGADFEVHDQRLLIGELSRKV